MSYVDGKVVFLTGGTGSFGKRFAKMVIENTNIKELRIYSRDELKQFEMQQWANSPKIKYILGDVRDSYRLKRAIDGSDVVVHAAAMKQVPASENNPIEAIRTNVIGAENVINNSIECGVKKVIALSTDKACNPINLYGATKLCSDKLFIAANGLVKDHATKFGVVRYGNVIGSRGSVIPFFLTVKKKGRVPITDERMTRFMITLTQGVSFVLDSLDRLEGGELFVPKIPTMNLMEIKEAVAQECDVDIIGIRPGEKIHESMIGADDSLNTVEHDKYYVIMPQASWWDKSAYLNNFKGKMVAPGFCYDSSQMVEVMNKEMLREVLKVEQIEI
ncbi:MAG: UDP-N-acetylglucosamine 4,6-dehydratase (inverting) [Bacteriovoracaceae bacterium]